MKIKVEQLDLERTKQHWPKETPFQPALIRSRKEDKRKWIVLSAPLVPGESPRWSKTEHDEYIRIPLFPYRLSPEADLALAFMIQLGLSCAAQLPAPVTDLFIVTGRPVELLYDSNEEDASCVGMRYWVGFGILTE